MRTWAYAAGVRALRTVAQSAVGAIGATAVVTEVHWGVVAGTAVLSGVLSILNSLAGLPEVGTVRD